jgi:predicted metalloprotease
MDINNRESGNVEDRRGGRGRYIAGGGIGTIILAVVVYFLGGDPSQVINVSQQQSQTQEYQAGEGIDDEGKKFVSVVLASTEDVWNGAFQQMGTQYSEPILVLFSEQTQSGCGGATQATGPFYCPADKKIYLDLSFFNELSDRHGVKGDFANAYVIAHEVGHHVQDLMGITTKVHNMQQRVSKAEANRLSVMLELQADFLAGYWAHYAKNLNLNKEDIESALIAANAIGDDRLQKQAQGYVVPDAFTHGTSQQRMYWFMKGYQSGDINQSNTFEDPNL